MTIMQDFRDAELPGRGFRIERRQILVEDGRAAGLETTDCGWTDNENEAMRHVRRLISRESGQPHERQSFGTGNYARRMVNDPDVHAYWRVTPFLAFALYRHPPQGDMNVCEYEECDNLARVRFCSHRCQALHGHRDRGRAAYQLRAEDQWTWRRIGEYLPKLAARSDPSIAAQQAASNYARTAGLPWPPLAKHAVGVSEGDET